MTIGTMTFDVMTPAIMAFSIMNLIVTLSIKDTHNDTFHMQ